MTVAPSSPSRARSARSGAWPKRNSRASTAFAITVTRSAGMPRSTISLRSPSQIVVMWPARRSACDSSARDARYRRLPSVVVPWSTAASSKARGARRRPECRACDRRAAPARRSGPANARGECRRRRIAPGLRCEVRWPAFRAGSPAPGTREAGESPSGVRWTREAGESPSGVRWKRQPSTSSNSPAAFPCRGDVSCSVCHPSTRCSRRMASVRNT